MTALIGLWRYGLVAALLAAAGVWHLADKSRAVDDAVEIVRSEYITAALAASESARSREQQLTAANQKVSHDLQVQKTRNAATAVANAGKLRDLQAALDSASAVGADTKPAGGDHGDPRSAIITECASTVVRLDEAVKKLASTARALQQYAAGVQLR